MRHLDFADATVAVPHEPQSLSPRPTQTMNNTVLATAIIGERTVSMPYDHKHAHRAQQVQITLEYVNVPVEMPPTQAAENLENGECKHTR
jgi:hypothetical protein